MPMDEPDKFGTEACGAPSKDYCCYCFKDGDFTEKQTLEEAVAANIPFWKNEDEGDDVARQRIMGIFPTLKRWAC